MSINLDLHHGYRLAAGTDRGQFTQRVRAVMDPVRDLLDARMFADLTVDLIDSADRRGVPRPDRPLQHVYEEWARDQARTSPASVWHDPHYMELKLGHDEVTGTSVLILLAGAPEYREALAAMPEVEPFTYSAITEYVPDGVSAAEWEHRRDVWTRLLPGGSSAAMEHFRLRPGGSTGYAEIKAMLATDADIRRHSPEVQVRTRRAAVGVFSSWLVKEQGAGIIPAFNQAGHTLLPSLGAAVAGCLAPAGADLFHRGAGTHGFDALAPDELDALCARDFADSRHRRSRPAAAHL